MSSNRQAGSRITQKRQQIRKHMRKAHINQVFQKIRKELEKDSEIEIKRQYANSEEKSVINECIEKIVRKQCYSQAIISIWKICIEGKKIKLLSKNSIAVLSKEFVQFTKRRTNDAKYEQQLMMLCWVIGNWCCHIYDFPTQMCEMVQAQVNILEEKNTSIKFNHLIIHHFTNICFRESIRRCLLLSKAIIKVVDCKVFQDRQSDKTGFLSNFLYNLPYSYKISAQCKDKLIFYLRATFEMSKLDYVLRLDSIIIIGKLLTINEGGYHRDVVAHLSPNIGLYIEKLEDDIKFQSLEDILELLIRLYKQRSYGESDSYLYSEKMYSFIWKVVKEHIQFKMEMYDQKVEALQNQIWEFLYQFCQIDNSQTIQNIIRYIHSRCLSKQIGDFEQRAVKILIKSYHCYNQQNFEFWAQELIQLYPDQYMCIDLLQIIRVCLMNVANSELLLEKHQRLTDLLKELRFNESSKISKLSYEIINFRSETAMIEQYSTSAAEKSFNTICEVLSTPLQVTSPSYSLLQQPSKFTTINQPYN